MMEPTPSRAPAGLRWIAILVALALGCTTVRAPASAMGDRIAVTDGRAEPQLELWIESARSVSPAESARAAEEARAALASAVAARQSPGGDELLVVRAQGIARTGSRKSSQGAAVAGMVVGAVVVVVVAVVMLVAGDGRGRGKGSAKAPARGGRAVPPPRGTATAAGAAAATAGRASPGRPAPAPAGGRPFPAPISPRPIPAPALAVRPAPAPWPGPGPYARPYSGPYVGFDFWWGFSLDLTPTPYAEEPWAATWEPFPTEAGAPWATAWQQGPPAGEGERAAVGGEVTTLVLAPPPELRVENRDFFAGDETVLELVWVDRHTGAPLRSKTVRAGTDPRDARAVRKLLDRALDDEAGWTPEEPPTAGEAAPSDG